MKALEENKPLVSIIPCRNEEKFISQYLDSIIAQNYPKDKLKSFGYRWNEKEWNL